DTQRTEITAKQPEASGESLISSGTIFRNFELSPTGGNDFTGGLQLQLQGKLTPDITVSGILSDQNFPIQPEGNTEALEEIDQVYLDISHPNFQINAGDLNVDLRSSRFARLERKVTGMKGNFQVGPWSGDGLVGGNGGRYTTYSFKGQDQNQGPYPLISKEGKTPVFVIAGSERVWVDGKRRVRGENRDYIIDYSTGEITFMSRIIILDDTDIFVEYEYRDGKYSRGLAETGLQHTFTSGINLGIQWTRDADNVPAGVLSSEDRQALTHAAGNSVKRSTAIPDSTGDYFYTGVFYMYDPHQLNHALQYYRITFEADPDSGAYRRQISSDGQIYYEYVSDSLRTENLDLFSPWTRIEAPEQLDLWTIRSSGQLGTSGHWEFTGHGSMYQDNRFSSLPTRNKTGVGSSFIAEGELGGAGSIRMKYAVEDWYRTAAFTALSNDRDVRFNRNWNLANNPNGREHLSSIKLGLNKGDRIQGDLILARYQNRDKIRYRYRGNMEASSRWVPRATAAVTYLDLNQSPFYQTNLNVSLLPWKIHPQIRFSSEQAPRATRYESAGTGLEIRNKNSEWRFGLDRRLDWIYRDSVFHYESADWITTLDGRLKTQSGWNVALNGSYRRKGNESASRYFTSTMGQIQVNYRNKKRTLVWNSSSRLEESQVQTRAIVYDSVGNGLGQYRYDPVFQEYIPDPNGAFIGTVVLTGDRHPAVSLDARQRLEMNRLLQHTLHLRSSRLVLDASNRYQGKTPNIQDIFSPKLNSEEIENNKSAFNQEWDISLNAVPLRIREWSRYSLNFQGLDPRGKDLRRSSEWGVEHQYSVTRAARLTVSLSGDRTNTESTVSSLRNRSSGSTWFEPGLKFSGSRKYQLDTRLRFAGSKGTQTQGKFNVKGKGLVIDGSWFIGRNHRIQGQLDWFLVTNGGRITDLPSDAMKGYTLGPSFRGQLQSLWTLGNNFHLNLSLNYINDAHYDNFIHFSGEVRAYF
ncbi:MAG: hypothetical protein GXO90_11305, partial [FCB group bacterium]|nr:hypothetical protein [FCB group bacterium]